MGKLCMPHPLENWVSICNIYTISKAATLNNKVSELHSIHRLATAWNG